MKEESLNILIIDDKPANIFSLEELLTEKGRKFFKAGNGNEALKILMNENIDLILLDVHMPGMSGFEVAEIIKSNQRTRDIPIIFASAERKEREFIMKGYQGGALDYLSKPLDPEITRAKVSVLLRLQQQKKELFEKKEELQKAHAMLEERVKERTSELVILNNELNKTLERLERSNRQLEEFAYVATHNMRAPMINLKGLIEMYAPLAKNDEIFKRIVNTSEYLNSVLNDLIGIAGLNKPITDKKTVEFEELASKIKQLLKTEIQSTGANIRTDFSKAESIVYPYSHLQNILQVLITNSISFRSENRRPDIKVETYHKGNNIILEVSDNGIGIDLVKHEDKLFRAFQKLHSGTPGKGLGLYIIKWQVELLGGKISVTSFPGQGATFTVSLVNDPKLFENL